MHDTLTRASRPKATRAARSIETEDDIRAGLRSLRRRCEFIRHMHATAGDPPLRRRAAGFEGLARIVVGQQLSVASAAAIWNRTVQVVQPFDAAVLLALSDDALRGAGLSRPKVKTLRAVASAVAIDGLDLEAMGPLEDAAIHEALTGISGIGPWTADIFLMFCLGRADAFAAGDLALQIAAQWAMRLDERPGPAALLDIAERWRPWRGVAARLLWAYYAAVKDARSAVPV
jgi:DNA-3-methyladenine glycosylase II